MNEFNREIINIEQLFDIKGVGVTSPIECRLENGTEAIVKYPYNTAGNQVLFNELLGYLVADAINTNIPRYGVCMLSEAVISSTNYNEEITNRNAGLCFYTEKISSTIPPSRVLVKVCEKVDTERLVLLDYLLNNFDRHTGNILLDINSSKIYVIDFSHIITRRFPSDFDEIRNLTKENVIVSSDLYYNNLDVYDMLGLSNDHSTLLSVATEIKSILTGSLLNRILELIPQQWIEMVTPQRVDLIIKMIEKRVLNIEKIAELINAERSK